MSYQNLLYAVDDRVATIALNRPERHNALSVALVDEIVAAVQQADSFLKTGKTGVATEKQLFDCVVITKDNVEQYGSPFVMKD